MANGYTQWHQCLMKDQSVDILVNAAAANGAPTDGNLTQGVFVGDCSAVGVQVSNVVSPAAGGFDVRIWLQHDNTDGVWTWADWLGVAGVVAIAAAATTKSKLIRVDTYGAQRLYVEILNVAGGALADARARGGTGQGDA